jgi:hypothetical protein
MAEAAALTNWRYDPSARQLEVTVKEGVTPRYFLMAQPARIVVDLPNTDMGEVRVKETYSGAIRQVRVSQFQPGLTRIVMELAADAVFAPGQVKLEKANNSTWVLRPLIANAPTSGVAERSPIQASGTIAAPTPTLPPPPQELDLPSSRAAIQPKPSTPRVQVPSPSSSPIAETQPPTAPSALPPEGSDISPMNTNLMGVDVSMPPAQSTSSGLAAASASPLKVSPGAIAQVSPTETTTPLPPSTGQSDSDLFVDVTKAVKLEVPPPVALPSNPASVLVPAPQRSPNGTAIDIPSTLRLPSDRPAQVTVPNITIPNANQLAAVPPAIAYPAPPQTAMPPLPLPVLTAPSVPAIQPIIQPPVSNGIQPSVSQVQPQTQPRTPNPEPLIPNPQPPTPNPQPLQPPISSVMQSGPPMQPLPSAVIQPPASSAIQMPVSQPPMSSVIQPIAISQPEPIATLPQTTFSEETSSQPSMVSVPPLSAVAPLPQTPAISVPPLQPMSIPSSASVTPLPMSPSAIPEATPAPSPTLEFGKPLPVGGATALNTAPVGLPNYSPSTATSSGSVTPLAGATVTPTGALLSAPMVYQSSVPGLILPAGTPLNLSYPGAVNLSLTAGDPRQEVLILQTEVRDSMGNVVFPRGSYVTGRFETNREGSKFLAQAISQGNRTLLFVAESDPISGNREISGSSLALYSGAGAIAGGLVSKFSGLGVLLGGAAGAATNVFTSPKPATIQPGQVIQVRMIRDVR